jgi:HK97 family phage prohead protease
VTPTRRPPLAVGEFRESLGADVLALAEPAASDPAGTLGELYGFGLRWNTWATIDSASEGRFVESFSPGAFDKSIRENGPQIRLLYAHGHDHAVGDRPLGPLILTASKTGLEYRAPLLDATYTRELAPAIRGGLMGASVRFSVVRDEFRPRPPESDYNPHGLGERVIREAKLWELSVVTFPAYSSSSANLRSSTDQYVLEALEASPARLHALQRATAARRPRPAPARPRRSWELR